MELKKFIALLFKHKYTLIAVPIIAVIATYFLTGKMPESYSSKARMATGLVEQSSSQRIIDNQAEAQESQINLQFSNLIQMMQLKKVMDQVSYQLILHDLQSTTPFHKPSKIVKDLNTDAKNHAIEVFKNLYNTKQPLQLSDPDKVGLRKVLISMGYDDETLRKKLAIYRAYTSDFIDIEFESDSPSYTAFVINSLCSEFINYYTSITKENQIQAVNFLDSLLKKKKDNMDTEMQDLKNYKISNRVLNLSEQAKSLYSQIADYDAKKQAAEKDIIAYTGAIKSIDEKFNPQDRQYLEGTLSKINQDITGTTNTLKQLTDQYVTSNYDPKYKIKIDSLQNVLNAQINESSDKYITNPLVAKENLINQKIGLEVQLDLQKNSINSLNNQLQRLNKKFDELVPHEAVIQAYEGAIDISSKEYIEILKKFNQTSMESNLSVQLRQVQQAMPGPPLPSKKTLLVAVSGIISIIVCLLVLFIIFYLDSSLKTPKELANKTQIPVLGFLPTLKGTSVDLNSIWGDAKKSSIEFKNLLRDLRFEIDSELHDEKFLMITSMQDKEGKTFTILSLAYAYSIINKKILLIDGNFDNPDLSIITKPMYYLEDYLSNKILLNNLHSTNTIDILGNRGSERSLFELVNKEICFAKLNALKEVYDLIIVEIPSVQKLNKAKEWIVFADKLLAVFQSNQSIKFEQEEQINYLKSTHQKFMGWIMNKVTDKIA